MAVVTMVNDKHKDDPGVYETTYHGYDGPLYMQTRFEGLVLADRERNGYDDSDFYAVVWDVNKDCPVEVEYGTTRFWTYPNHCTVDATPEIRAKYEAWRAEQERQAREAARAREAATPRPGRTLRVVKGRKVPVGTVGECFWTGNGNWGPRVGLRDAEGNTHWTALSNVEVVQNDAN